MEKKFNKVYSASDIIITLLFIIIGIVLTVITKQVSIIILGGFFIAVGIVLIFVLKSHYKYVETGEKFKKSTKYFDSANRVAILHTLQNEPENMDLTNEGKNNSLKMDIYYNKENAYVQLFVYVPHEYQEFSELMQFKTKQISKLIKK